MRVLIDNELVVRYIGEVIFDITEKCVNVYRGTAIEAILDTLNLSNCSSVLVTEDIVIPANACNRYKFKDNAFIINEQYIKPSLNALASLIEMVITPPKYVNEEEVLAKTNDILQVFIEHCKTTNKYVDVDPDIIKGVELLKVDDLYLTELQLQQKIKAHNFRAKLKARVRIEQKVGDSLDQLASISKRLASDERMLHRLFLHVLGVYPISEEIKERYAAYVLPVIQAADANQIVDRIDLEDEETMMTQLFNEKDEIAVIIQQYKQELK